MRGKAYRRLLSARRRPLLVLLLCLWVLVVYVVTGWLAPRWVGVEALIMLMLLIAACLTAVYLRQAGQPAAPAPFVIDPLEEVRADSRWAWVDDPEVLRRLEHAQRRRALRTGRVPR